MERWNGKVAVVTGASAGIGLATAKAFVKQGLIVIGLARRIDKMQKEMSEVKGPGQFHARECDISKKIDVIEAFSYIKNTFKTLHILVNNAGVAKVKTIEDAEMEELEQIINVNVMGLLQCTKSAIKLMKENGEEGYIINICSVAGHAVPNIKIGDQTIHLNVYPPSKFAVRAISEVLSNELKGSKIRVSNLSPGYVKTEMTRANLSSDIPQEVLNIPGLYPEDIADSIIYMIGTPIHVHIPELVIKPHNEVI